MKKRATIYFMLTLTAIGLLTSCASIIHGKIQTVDFTSQPSGAKITIDGKDSGVTPKAIVLLRKGREKGESKEKKEYVVKIELEGFYPYEVKIKREVDGWFFGNLLFGGLIGIIVDASNGAMYKLTPNQVIATMGRTTAMAIDKLDDKVYIAVMLDPNPNWERIGTLKKVD